MRNKRVKWVIKAWAVEVLVFLLIFFGLKRHGKFFSADKMEEMMVRVSESRDLTDDPCKYAIKGDPKTLDYIKIDFWCRGGDSSRSTLDRKGMPKTSLNGVFDEYYRILGLDVEKIRGSDSWQCLVNGKAVADWEMEVGPQSTISCVELEDKR